MEQSPSETAAASSPPKKKRGRPKKADKPVLQNEASAATKDAPKVRRKRKKGFLKSVPVAANHGKKKRLQQGMSPSTTQISDSDGDATTAPDPEHVPEKEEKTVRPDVNVGQQVHGVVDGMFDAGYLVTVRVGDGETVFRGVVFGPGLSLPLNKENDVAPKLKRMNQDNATPDAPSLHEGAAAPVASPPTVAHAAKTACLSISPNSMPPATEAHGAVTIGTGTGMPRPSLSTSNLPPPSGGAPSYGMATTYRSPLFVPSPLQNASGGFYYAPPSHTSNPNGNHAPAHYPPRGFPAYAFQYPTATAEYNTGSTLFAGPPPPPAAAASVSPLPNTQGTLPPRTS